MTTPCETQICMIARRTPCQDQLRKCDAQIAALQEQHRTATGMVEAKEKQLERLKKQVRGLCTCASPPAVEVDPPHTIACCQSYPASL